MTRLPHAKDRNVMAPGLSSFVAHHSEQAGAGLCHQVDLDSCPWAHSPHGCIEPSLGFGNPDSIVSNCADMPLKRCKRKCPNCVKHQG